tara:strand:- start:8070 stop:8972 length:903 start_codon:yes stop_codon:yes gene_type:complete
MKLSANTIAEEFKRIQASICSGLEALDGKAKFASDLWNRPGGGGGDTRVIQNGEVFEKGGVNFSAVHGETTPELKQMLNTEAKEFFATGVSIVLHPNNPFVPIIHMNIRYFELPGTDTYWFGGGIDLTPSYVFEDDAIHFHGEMKALCERHAAADYQKFKKTADEYFYIPHRGETRGLGGIFFDHLNESSSGFSKEDIAQFVFDTGNTFLQSYVTIAEKRKNTSFTPENKEWQLLRRGRYVEFNLIYDRGTTFGLKTNGRVESILMSLPKHASWEYNFEPKPSSREEISLQYFKKAKDWV